MKNNVSTKTQIKNSFFENMALISDGDDEDSEKDHFKEFIPKNTKKNTSKNKYGFALKSPNVAF